MTRPRSLILVRPDDWHVHLRDKDLLMHTVPATAKQFARALVMPNLNPALTSLNAILEYKKRIQSADPHHEFAPLMTFYLNESVQADELIQLNKYPFIVGAKLYPAGATTNSAEGVTSLHALYPLLEIMQQENLVLQIHGEVTHGDVYDREGRFIEEHLKPLMRDFPKLRMVLEHISTKSAVDFIINAPETIAATITPHHLLFNRNHLLEGGLKPHYYCLPILKRSVDQIALLKAAVSGNPKFFAGTDSAPHAKVQKESPCGCAGIYSAPFALPLYAEAFSQAEQLSKLNAFMSEFGAHFYQQPTNESFIELRQTPQTIPEVLPLGHHHMVVPMAAGQTLQWSVHEPG